MLIQWQTGKLTIIRWKQKNRQTGKDRVRMRHKEGRGQENDNDVLWNQSGERNARKEGRKRENLI